MGWAVGWVVGKLMGYRAAWMIASRLLIGTTSYHLFKFNSNLI